MIDEDFGERFLQANANADYMAHQLADCVRHCIRGMAAQQQGSQAIRAAERFKLLIELLVRSKGIGFHEIFDKAIQGLRRDSEQDLEERAYARYRRSIVEAAEKGAQFLVESSCSDNAAAGRASRRKHEFLEAIKEIGRAREAMSRND